MIGRFERWVERHPQREFILITTAAMTTIVLALLLLGGCAVFAAVMPPAPVIASAAATCVHVDGYDVCRVDFVEASCFFWSHDHRAISCIPTTRGAE